MQKPSHFITHQKCGKGEWVEDLFQKHTSDVQGNPGVGSPVLGVHSLKFLTGKAKSAQI